MHINSDLWTYQVVKWKGQVYLLTRLGFGLSVAPKVMTSIVEWVLRQDKRVCHGTSSYIDDILVDETVVEADIVVWHLQCFGLQAKPPERMGAQGGIHVLGVHVDENGGWKKDGVLPGMTEKGLMRRQVDSLVGEWLGHFPVAGWLHAACGHLQRCSAEDGVSWDEEVSEAMRQKVLDVEKWLRNEGDPVTGRWAVNPGGKVILWVDASNMALGVAFDVNGEIIEDASWLWGKNDSSHINLAELDAVLKGIGLAHKWGMQELVLVTDSVTVFG